MPEGARPDLSRPGLTRPSPAERSPVPRRGEVMTSGGGKGAAWSTHARSAASVSGAGGSMRPSLTTSLPKPPKQIARSRSLTTFLAPHIVFTLFFGSKRCAAPPSPSPSFDLVGGERNSREKSFARPTSTGRRRAPENFGRSFACAPAPPRAPPHTNASSRGSPRHTLARGNFPTRAYAYARTVSPPKTDVGLTACEPLLLLPDHLRGEDGGPELHLADGGQGRRQTYTRRRRRRRRDRRGLRSEVRRLRQLGGRLFVDHREPHGKLHQPLASPRACVIELLHRRATASSWSRTGSASGATRWIRKSSRTAKRRRSS